MSPAACYLGPDEKEGQHSCISARFYSLFRNDWDAKLNPLGLDEDLMEDTCSASESGSIIGAANDSDGEVCVLISSCIIYF